MDLLKKIFLVFIFLFPFAEVGRLQFSNGVSVTVNDVGLILVLLVWFIYKFNKKWNLKKNFLFKPILIFLSVATVSLLLNIPNLSIPSFFISLLYLVRFVAYSFLYFVIREFDTSYKRKISLALLASGFIVVVIGFVQYLFYPSLKNLFYLGWDEHLYRMFSTFLDPNFAGVFFVIYFLFTLGFLKESLQKKHRSKSIILSIISMLTLISVYLTYSRSAFLMLVLGVVVFLYLLGKRKVILVTVIILIALIFISPKAFKTEGTDFLRVNSSSERVESLQTAVKIFQDSPIYGVGFNAYRYAQNRHGLNNIYWQTTHSGAGTDNSFLFILATNGVVGLAFYLYLIFKIGQLASKNLKNINSLALLSSLIGLCIGSLFVNSLFYVFILEWIWIMSGLTESS